MQPVVFEDEPERPARRIVWIIAFLAVAATAVGICAWVWSQPAVPQRPTVADLPEYRPEPVPANREPDVQDGFQGDIHPLLHGSAPLEVTAHWSGVGTGRDQLDQSVPPAVYRMFTEFQPAIPRAAYTERELSVFLPESVESVGQTWEVAAEGVAPILRQFHPHPSLHLVAFGRRAGPDGAFAVLRALSPTHLDIALRIHAEFDLAQNVWLTPACFQGRLIVDRAAGTIVHFRLWTPTDNPLNMHLTAAESMPPGGTEPEVFRKIERGDMVIAKRDIVRVEQMELIGGDGAAFDQLAWTEEISPEAAQRKLRRQFYTFENIGWVPWQEATRVAQAEQRPILAIVLWGALDDQSC